MPSKSNQIEVGLIERLTTIPNKNIIANAATKDNPAPDNDASVKSLGIFLQRKERIIDKQNRIIFIVYTNIY